MTSNDQSPHILIFYTETGGTHANAAKAIAEAVRQQPGQPCTVELLDVWKSAKFPMNLLPRMIFWFRGHRPVSKWHSRNSHQRQRLTRFNFLARGYLKKFLVKTLSQHPCDLIVSVHSITSAPVLEVLPQDLGIPFVVVVTDIATRNIFWFDQRSAMTILPTVHALNVAAQLGLPFDRVQLLGVPVPQTYCVDQQFRPQVCEEFGLDAANPVILVASGKAGIGPLDAVAQKIDQRFSGINLLVLTGRNEDLRKRLNEYNWNNPVRIFGLVNDLWRLMWSADIMVTKAGTGMLAEALSVTLPMILFHRVPYLEDANVSFLVEQGAALWAPSPPMVVNALSRWLEQPAALAHAKRACQKLVRPDAAAEIAQMITQQAKTHFERNQHDNPQ
ncbi:MAG: hypothetical protein JW750_11810 [Anaerolineaceae bacterium]|nr:hypothetical protein [Anaerolineaceae bacterium]